MENRVAVQMTPEQIIKTLCRDYGPEEFAQLARMAIDQAGLDEREQESIGKVIDEHFN